MNTDIELVNTVLSTGFSNLIRCLVFIVAVLILLFSISVQITWLVLLGVLAIMIVGVIVGVY